MTERARKIRKRFRAMAAGIGLAVVMLAPAACAAPAAEAPAPAAPASTNETVHFAVPPPPFSEGIFPCSDCHVPGDEVDRTPRVLLDMHEDIVLRHDEAHRWCLDCHDAGNRDKLHLAGGTLVDFSESYRLCGQCHGTQYRDWRAGVHGKRTGDWNGKKQYLLCAHCHNPHAPAFPPMEPLPPPVRPENLK